MNSTLRLLLPAFAGLICIGAILTAGCVMGPSGNTTVPSPSVTVTMVPGQGQQNGPSVTMLRDMASLDKAYIPVLALTSQNNSAASRKAMDTLLPAWTTFQARYTGHVPADPLWNTDLETVNMTIRRANTLINEGNLSGAHTELEQVRLTMLDLRTRNHITYFIDNLTLFHDPMERIYLAAYNRPLGEVDVPLIAATLPEAEARWRNVSGGNISADLFDFNQSKVDQIQSLINNESAAIENLKNAIRSGDNNTIANASVAIRGPFSQLFSAYGTFPS